MARKEISFSQNWNLKLNCKYFTTIRKQNPKKYAVGEEYHIMLRTGPGWVTDFGHAVAVDIKQIQWSDLNNYICGLDTGYSVDETKDIFRRMYKGLDVDNAFFSLVLLKYTH